MGTLTSWKALSPSRMRRLYEAKAFAANRCIISGDFVWNCHYIRKFTSRRGSASPLPSHVLISCVWQTGDNRPRLTGPSGLFGATKKPLTLWEENTFPSVSFLRFKWQQMVNEAHKKEFFKEQSEAATCNCWLETNSIAEIASCQDRGGESIPNNKMI